MEIFNDFNLYLLLRIGLSVISGFLVGSERETKNKSAGTRTHTLVCLGACLAMIISKYGFSDVENYDAARVAAQIVSGVGFLGAGVIFVKNYGVTGLTTAAGIWTTSIVGMAFGAGMYLVGIVTVAFIIIFQSLMFPSDIFSRHDQFTTIVESKEPEVITKIDTYMEKNHLHRKSYRLKYREDTYTLNFQIFPKDAEELNQFISFLQEDLKVDKFDIF